MNPEWVAALTAFTVAVVTGMAWGTRRAWHATRWLWHIGRRTSRFLDDYFGEPARDGLPARPGIMGRLKSVEDAVGHVASEIAKVAVETMPNDGTSMHDVLARTEQSVDEIRSEQVKMRARMELFETQRGEREDEESP